VFDELKKRDNTSYNIAGLIFLANVRTYKTEMADLLSFGDGAMQKDFYGVMQGINWMMNNFGMTVIGANDDFAQHQYTFTGINDVYESFMLDLAGACEIPVTRLFQRDPAGLNATGESDLTNYYDMIEEKQETYLRPVLDKLLPVIAMSAWGYVPEDLDYKFNPLRKADPKENADLSKSITDSVIAAFNAGLISQQVALKEMRQQSELTGMWSNITDEDIARANADVDLGMGEMGGATGGGMELPGLGSLAGPLAGLPPGGSSFGSDINVGTKAPALAPGSLVHLVKDARWNTRGGNPENSGRFSKTVGSGSKKVLLKRSKPAKLKLKSTAHPKPSNPHIKNSGVTNTSGSRGNDSLAKHTGKDGKLTQEREALHQSIINETFKDAVPAEGQAVFTVMGGGSGSGKGTLRKKGVVKSPEGSIVIDADEIKDKLPEYKEMVAAGGETGKEAAGYAHEESSALAKRILGIATEGNFNHVLDGTGDGTVESMEKKIAAARAAGMTVNGVYVTVPIETAVKWAEIRGQKSGRHVDPDTIRDIHAKVSRILPQIADKFDDLKLYDNSGDTPILIATGGNGKGLSPAPGQEEKLREFIAKGRLTT
jgi:predicted ABC-type ATPase